MKKLVLLTCLAALVLLAIPASGLAAKAGDFDLGGYVKLETFWDSTQMAKDQNTPAVRRNAAQPNRVGRLTFNPSFSRFYFTIRGPEVLGAKTMGYIELDFDANPNDRKSSTNPFQPRMRHAFFRMDWPGGWQLLIGQYWGLFCDFYPETVGDTALMNHGYALQRLPQIRLTYKTGPWTFAGLVGQNYDPIGDNATTAYGTLIGSQAASTNLPALIGQRSNFPQFQGSVTYEKDLWGKAGYWGRPRGFAVNVAAGITRINYPGGELFFDKTKGWHAFTWGQNDFQLINATKHPLVNNSQTLVPWVVQATLFIPVLTTTTQNLKNTASITVNFQVGQGHSFYGNGRDADNTWFQYDGFGGRFDSKGVWKPELNYKRRLTSKYGGYIQAQYYFNNHWYVSYLYGFAKPYGVSQARNAFLPTVMGSNPEGYEYATLTDQTRMWQEHQATLFFTPAKALKFGLCYSFIQTDYFQITTVGPRMTRTGENHSIRFAGWFFF